MNLQRLDLLLKKYRGLMFFLLFFFSEKGLTENFTVDGIGLYFDLIQLHACIFRRILSNQILILTTLPGQFQDVHSPDKLSYHDIVSGTLEIFTPPPQ